MFADDLRPMAELVNVEAEGGEVLGMTQVMCWRVWVEGDVINQRGLWGL